ncbi:predicted protein [Uncinocarpus reesii 1704]|uniref:Fe2OG dioxygenase domain-containing protein n=1 Tax=Uncinocarpus reesii (strain UAMH 1704) TaxID=336963 RepID=C4JJ67_UNCRE|nr:uncharacterized protein UREG_01674 [Uncinocarpus reesii 1704]EEP76825.1 predicted protein [Uncinocarpus reesii 1704]
MTPASNVKAERYKFLLYEEGAFFLPHQDSPKSDRMFGTLVICLPSKHEGGELIVTHHDKTRVIRTSTTSAYGTSFAAWYADVTHEIKPVKLGHRAVITYNLIDTGAGSVPVAPVAGQPEPGLENAFKLWRSSIDSANAVQNNHNDPPKFLLYQLSYQYPSISFDVNSLKGEDKQQIRRLEAVGGKLGFQILLGFVKRVVYGECEDEYRGDRYARVRSSRYHAIVDPIGDSAKLEKAVDLTGETVLDDLKIKAPNFIFDGALGVPQIMRTTAGSPGMKGCLQHTPIRERWAYLLDFQDDYQTDTATFQVAMILPHDFIIALKCKSLGSSGVSNWLDQLLPSLSDPDYVQSRNEFNGIVKFFYDRSARRAKKPPTRFASPTSDADDEVLSKITQGFSVIGDMEACEKAITGLQMKPAPELFPCIVKLFKAKDIQEAIVLLDTLAGRSSSIGESFDVTFELAKFCREKLGTSDDQVRKRITEWETSRIKSILRQPQTSYCSQDGLALARLAQRYPEADTQRLIKRVALKMAGKNDFIFPFLDHLCTSWAADPEQQWISILCQTVLEWKIRNLKLGDVAPYSLESTSSESDADGLSGEHVCSIIKQCHLLNLNLPVKELLRGIRKISANSIEDENFATQFAFPFFKEVLQDLNACGLEETGECLTLVGAIIEDYVRHNVGACPPIEPFEPPRRAGCICYDCREFNRFLLSTETSQVFHTGSTKKHLEKLFAKNELCLITERVDRYRTRVTKDFPPHVLWEEIAKNANQLIQSIGTPAQVRAVLGAECFRALVDLRILESTWTFTDKRGTKRPASQYIKAERRPNKIIVID